MVFFWHVKRHILDGVIFEPKIYCVTVICLNLSNGMWVDKIWNYVFKKIFFTVSYFPHGLRRIKNVCYVHDIFRQTEVSSLSTSEK